MTQEPKALLDAYLPLVDCYKRLAQEVAERLARLSQEAGLRPAITHRAKDVRSLIKKCLLYDGPVEKVPDKAGVKVVVRYASEVETVSALILTAFDSDEPDIKAANIAPNELRYLGTHHQVRLPLAECPEDLVGLECEIIIHTGAEALWDSITHELMYKPLLELPQASQRTLNRLLVLVELFDKEVASVRAEYLASPTFREAQMLDILEKYFYRLDPRKYERDLSIRTLEALAPLVGEEKLAHFDEVIGAFVEDNLAGLQNAYTKFQDESDIRGLFLHQPESLLIFAMLSWNQKAAVKNAWIKLYPRDYLVELGGLWSVAIPR